MKICNFLKLGERLKETSHRFPLGVGILVLLTLIFLYVIHSDGDNVELLIQIVCSLIITFFSYVGLVIYTENMKKISHIKKYSIQALSVLFGGLFFWSFNGDLESFETLIFFILSMIGIFGFLFSAPYLQKKVFPGEVYYNYLYTTLSAFILAYIMGIFILLLGVIALGAIDTLITNVDETFFGYWITISCVLVAPLFGLSYLPDNKEVHKEVAPLNSFVKFMIQYALFPAICVYFIILYIYSIKLALSFGDWPKGEVSWLVIGFTIFGYITYILSYIYTKSNKAIGIFRKYFPYAVLPQILILFYSIYLRIAQYDLTINRYFIVLFGISLTVLSLYFIFSSAKRLIAFPVSLICISLLVSIGPWSIYQLPASSQLKSLKSELVEANILQGETIVPLANKTDISKELSNSIYTKIDYLCDYHSCYGLEELFAELYATLEDDPSRWTIVHNITEKIGVDRHYSYGSTNDNYFSVGLGYNSSFFPIDVSGYSQIIEISSYNNDNIYIDYDKKILVLKEYPEIGEIFLGEIFYSLEKHQVAT
ncbi:DUF4153 domain-containing protein, partial [Candidatus Gracilibacteria bacterium]|nr:DUF4153 domain-containing protein [Candidatus Gracilibacteria bacterium]